MTIAHPDPGRTAGFVRRADRDARLAAWFGAPARRLIGILAMTLLIGWLVVAAGRNENGTTIEPQRQQAEDGPVFDGRGKWSGYAR